MNIRSYLPSAQFTLIVCAIAVSVGLVWAAERVARPPSYGGITAGGPGSADESAWRQELLALGGPTNTPTTATVADLYTLLGEAETSNLTESVGRSLLLNLSAAQAENLANDESAQADIVEQALAQAGHTEPPKRYGASDLRVVEDSAEAMRAYGNGVMAAVRDHEAASWSVVAQAVGLAVDNADDSQGGSLRAAAEDYRALSEALSALSVPQSLLALHIRMLNNFSAEASACDDMALVVSDPLRGLRGFQNYQTLVSDNVVVFTSLNAAFTQRSILFTKDEPGYAWNLLKPASQ